MWNHAAPSVQRALESVGEMHVQAVRQQMTAAKPGRIRNQLVEVEADRRIIRGDDGAGAHADDRVDAYALSDQLPQHADMSGAAQTARAQDDGSAHGRLVGSGSRHFPRNIPSVICPKQKRAEMAAGLQMPPAVSPEDPISAKQIVAEYARVLNRDLERGRFPLADDSLPYAKQTIKTAIETSLVALTSSGQLTHELRDFLETAYVSLADYVAPDLARLMREYSSAGDDLAADSRLAREKTAGAAWQTIAEGSRLAGEIARTMAGEAEQLKSAFQKLITWGAAKGRETGGTRAQTT